MSGTPETTTRLSVGVALATYNGELFLHDQLVSVLGQSRLPDEIVVSDDQSTDQTLAIVREVLEGPCADAGITLRIISHDTPAGAAANFANALAHCTTDLVALCDQDDVWLPHKLESLAAHFDANPELLMVHSDAELIDEEGRQLGMRVLDSLRITKAERRDLESGHGIHALARRNLVTGQTAMLRRTLVDLAGDIPEGFVHDEWWALVASSCDALVLDPGVFQHYRQHGRNEIGADKSGWQRLRERLAESQSSFRARHRTRHEGLAAFLDSNQWPGTDAARQLLKGRIAHYEWQAGLPRSRWARLMPIKWRYWRGDYRRYRRGLFDAMRDFFQPGI